ncbi:MAG: O-methyltransferase [Peptoanaerobacter stomatis]|uniref:O-methyltransferase n=1 Tax=Peptoanaerobacter stomatis TaxID=796937 RepID=UPI003F9F6137
MYKINDVTYEQIFEYIDEFNKKENIIIDELRVFAEQNNIPIIKKDVENFLKTYLNITKPKKILELGCAIGYSSIFMSSVLNDDVHIDTLEINENMYSTASENIKKFSLTNINVILGNASDIIPSLDQKYDFVFIDASKSHYDEFFSLILNKLEKNAVVICDNTLFKGYLCMDRSDIPKRQKTIYDKMTRFLENIKKNEDISYNMLPLGDGLLVIYFK